jgi:DNA mismatch repair protein MutS2
MMFDEKSLEPMYIGLRAGSSFTLRFKKRNPFSLINRAKKKLLEKYVSTKPLLPFRATKWNFRTLKEEKPKREEGKKMETINIKIKQKLESYQEL